MKELVTGGIATKISWVEDNQGSANLDPPGQEEVLLISIDFPS